MEQEIFDDYTWNEHKKILTADKHKIPGLRNLSHFTPMAPGVPVPLHYHSDIIELHFMVKGQRKTYVMKGGVRTSYCATGNNLFITRPYELHTTGRIAQNRCEFFAMQLDLKEHDNFLGLNQHYSNILCHRLLNMDQHLYHVGSSQISMLRTAFNLISYGTDPVEYLSIAFFEHMNLDGVGDMDDAVTTFTYGYSVSPGPLTVVEVTLGTGETLRWEDSIAFPNCFSAYLTTPDRQSLVLDLGQLYAVPHYTYYVVLSVENGTLDELYRLEGREGPAWISGAYTQERLDGLSDLYLPALSDDKIHTLWYTLSWSGDQFVLSQLGTP